MSTAVPRHGETLRGGSTSPAISIVVPVYNSAQILPQLIAEVERFFADSSVDGELVLVNDGSRDESWQAIRSAGREREWIVGIDLARNYGQHGALLCGIRAARGEVIVTIDDDLQHPPSEIPKLLDALGSSWDVVYGVPESEQHGFLRDLASRITKIALKSAMGVEIAREASAFRAFRASVRDGFATYRGTFVAIDVLLTWGAGRFTSVKVRHDPRRSGTSNYSFRHLLTHALNMMTGFSVVPLQIASWIGFAFTLFGLAVLAWVVGRYLVSKTSVAGFPFLASIIAIFSGSQLFALGILGEYLARIHTRSMEKPPYVIRETSSAGATDLES